MSPRACCCILDSIMASSGGAASAPAIWAKAPFAQRTTKPVYRLATRFSSWSIDSSPCWVESKTQMSSARAVWASATVSHGAPCPRCVHMSGRSAIQPARVHLNNMRASDHPCAKPTPSFMGRIGQYACSKVTMARRASRMYAIPRCSNTLLFCIARRMAKWRMEPHARARSPCAK